MVVKERCTLQKRVTTILLVPSLPAAEAAVTLQRFPTTGCVTTATVSYSPTAPVRIAHQENVLLATNTSWLEKRHV